MLTFNYVANESNLLRNSVEAPRVSTNKFEMRKALNERGIPCPKFQCFSNPDFTRNDFSFPVIVKPTDRSGSRGVTKVEDPANVNQAIEHAIRNSIEGQAIVEEFMEGKEVSVEMISYQGVHYPLTITDKHTTGEPHFVEIGQHQPSNLEDKLKNNIYKHVIEALNALSLKNGASHAEVFITNNYEVWIIEVPGRMGGDLIGSHLVELSTGYDFVKGVIYVALGTFEGIDNNNLKKSFSGVYYVLPETSGEIEQIFDYSIYYENIVQAIPILKVGEFATKEISSSNQRAGLVVYQSDEGKVNIKPEEVLKIITKGKG